MVDEGDSMMWLMPLAAILGTYTLIGSCHLLWTIYGNIKATEIEKRSGTKSWKSKKLWLTLSTVVLCGLGYGRICAVVSKYEELKAPFNPYEILKIDDGSTNSTLIKTAYRNASRESHPDKGGDAKTFDLVNAAYRALTDEEGILNWEQFGHPDGSSHFQTLSFGLPEWLLKPKGMTAVILVLMYFSLLIGIGYILWNKSKGDEKSKTTSAAAMSNSVATDDLKFLVNLINAGDDDDGDEAQSHLDLLFLVASTPEIIEQSSKAVQYYEKCKKQKLVNKAEEEKKKNTMLDLSGAWGDDDADSEDKEESVEQIQARKLEEELARKKKALMAQATGAVDYDAMKIEDIDSGVIGPKWVRSTLEDNNIWPPKFLDDLTISSHWRKQNTSWTFEGQKYTNPLAFPPIQRNFVLLLARVNSQLLNGHPIFLTSSQSQKLDTNYYKNSLEFRQKIHLLLEGILRIMSSTQNYPLVYKILQTSVLFRVGCFPYNKEKVDWFHSVVKRQYGVIPSVSITSCTIETLGEDEIATNDTCTVSMTLKRSHAEAFMKGKIAIAEKQGIPKEFVLQSYREVWWVLIRCKLLTKANSDDPDEYDYPKHLEELEKVFGPKVYEFYPKSIKKDKLLSIWPMTFSKVGIEEGNAKVKFLVPSLPGKYKFSVELVSNEFMGCDSLCDVDDGGFVVECDILDSEEIQRKEDEEDDKKEK